MNNKSWDYISLEYDKCVEENQDSVIAGYLQREMSIVSGLCKMVKEKSKMLSDVIKRITKFAAIGIAGVSTWLVTNISIHDRIAGSIESALKYPRPTLPPYMTPIEPQSADGIIPIALGIAVVGFLLVIDRIIPRIRLHRLARKQ